MGGSSLRARGPHSIPVEHESLLSPPLPPLPLPPPPSLSRRFAPGRDRRALSLELPELLQVPAVLPLNPLAHKKSLLGAMPGPGLSGEHQDCNGRAPSPTPQLLGEVYPQVSTRAEREELDEEIDYVSEATAGRPERLQALSDDSRTAAVQPRRLPVHFLASQQQT